MLARVGKPATPRFSFCKKAVSNDLLYDFR